MEIGFISGLFVGLLLGMTGLIDTPLKHIVAVLV